VEKAIVINIASVVEFKRYIHQYVFSSKHARTSFIKSFAKEVQHFGIWIHLTSPETFTTEIVTKIRPKINVKKLIQPKKIAKIVHFIINCKGNCTID